MMDLELAQLLERKAEISATIINLQHRIHDLALERVQINSELKERYKK